MTPADQTVKHLEMIQVIVSRLAGNSFSLKGWSITLVSALFALSAKEANVRYAALALLPALCFWGLDAYYLREERLFRKLHDAIRTGQAVGTPPTVVGNFAMSTKPVAALVPHWGRTLVSKSVFWLHFPVVLAVVIVTVYAATY